MKTINSKQSKISEIPKGWEIIKIKDLLVTKGYIRGPFGSALRRRELKTEGIPVYEQQHAIEGIRTFRYFIDQEKHTELKRFSVEENDLLISCSGTLGKVSLIGPGDPKGIISQALLILRADPVKILPEYLKQFFQSPNGYASIVNCSTGSVQVNIARREIIENIQVTLPGIDEQRAIAKILGGLDEKIELNHRMNKTLEAIAQAIFKRWFVEFKFPGYEKTKFIGGLSEKWKIGKLGDLVKNFDSRRVPLSSRERTTRHGIYPYYGAASVMDWIDDYLFDGVYVLMGEDGTVVTDGGYPTLQYVWGKFWVNNHAHVFQGKDGIPTEYILLLLQQMNVNHIVTGAVQPKINQSNMNSLETIVPDKKILDLLSETIRPIYEKFRDNADETKTLIAIRDSLLPKLTNGKIRVNYGA